MYIEGRGEEKEGGRNKERVGTRGRAQGKARGRDSNPNDCLIEVGMRIPMGTITKDYIRAHRLAPTQCTPNMFKILGSVDALNERMGLNLTHHDVNWIYNLHHLMGQGYYLKSRCLEVRLIQCLPDSNNGLKKDFLIVSGSGTMASPVQRERGYQVGF